MMINLKPYTTVPVGAGETVRVNHQDCPAGQDTRRRLYLTRPYSTPNLLIAWCHNCQNKGIKTLVNYTEFRGEAAIAEVEIKTEQEFAPPSDLVYEVQDWPTDAMAWKVQSKLSTEVIEGMGIAYDTSNHRIYLPIWDTINVDSAGYEITLLGYQLRRLTGDGAKYITVLKDGDTTAHSIIYSKADVPVDYGVVVEDLVSGLHIAVAFADEPENVAALINYGTKISLEVLGKLLNFKEGIVWLDNDSPHVDEQAHNIAKVWRTLSNKDVRVEVRHPEPKHLTDTQIKQIIREDD